MPGYTRYLEAVPKDRRRRRVHPNTPDITRKWSKRQFEGLVKVWRRALHRWDPEQQAARDAAPPVTGAKREREREGGEASAAKEEDKEEEEEGAKDPRARPPPARLLSPLGEDWVLVEESPAKRTKVDPPGKVQVPTAEDSADIDPAAGYVDEEDEDWFAGV